MKKIKFTVIASIIFIITAGIWYQVSFPVNDAKEQLGTLDEEYCDELYGNAVKPNEEPNGNSVTKEPEEAKAPDGSIESIESAEQESSTRKCCYICGFVKNPGVYEFEDGDRLSDMITKAGGFSKGAAKEYLNLAGFCEDGEKVYVPSLEEVKDRLEPIEQSSLSEDNLPSRDGKDGTEQASQKDKININTADEGSLTTLPGIGEAKAKRILSYREEHGGFGSIEEIKNIEGIKDGVFRKIQELITVQS